MMFCRKCGKSIPDDSKFCPYCGESVKLDDLTQKSSMPSANNSTIHGFCTNCGSPLPNGKLTGLCETCKGKNGIETAEFGRCELCGAPLEPDDDEGTCKNCKLDSEYEDRKRAQAAAEKFYSSEPTNKIHKGHGALIAVIITISLIIVPIVLSIALNSSTSSTQARANSSSNIMNGTNQETQSSSSTIVSFSAPAEETSLELLSDSGSNEGAGGIHITGTIKNNTQKTYKYVQVQYALYDKDNNQVGTALANTNGLEPGGTWKFDAIGIAKDVDTYKVINLSGF